LKIGGSPPWLAAVRKEQKLVTSEKNRNKIFAINGFDVNQHAPRRAKKSTLSNFR
jgi:hypothetical protein